MSDFSPPFANNGERRAPTTDEKSLGFPCGPADQRLFNFLVNLLTGNIKDIADEAGVTSNEVGDHTVLKRAVLALIEAAIGEIDVGEGEGPDLSNLILMSQARTRLPIFPDIQTGDGRLSVTVPTTGQIRIAGGQSFLHRGIKTINTNDYSEGERTFATDPSKIYHLRWTLAGGFILRDISSGTYNPGSLPETDASFDTVFDDMLIARIVTNSSNVATITPLVNRHTMRDQIVWEGAMTSNAGQNNARRPFTSTINWARTPDVEVALRCLAHNQGSTTDFDQHYHPGGQVPSGSGSSDFKQAIQSFNHILNRYQLSTLVWADGAQGVVLGVNLFAD